MEYTAEWRECYQRWGTALCGAAVLPLVMLVTAGIHWSVWEDGSPVLWVLGGKGEGTPPDPAPGGGERAGREWLR